MYYYIVDPQQLSQKEFERVQNILYSSLSEFRISGEVVRTTGLRTVQQLVENAFSHEARTIVAVGSDETLNEVINAVGKREMVVGFIPIVASELAKIFGIKDIAHAVKTIALPFTGVLIVFSAGKMLVEASLFSHGREKEMSPLKKSALLMAGPLRAWTSQRFVYGILGGIVLPVVLVAGQDYLAPAWILVLVWGIVGLSVAAEMMERYLFFRAVIPLKMPQ